MNFSNSVLVLCDDADFGYKCCLNLAKQILKLNDTYNIKTNPDFHVFENTTEDRFLTEEAEGLIENTILKPHICENKVYIIKNAESLTKVVQNKLLKTIEEPNLNSYIILSAKTEEGLLPTILSRVQKIKQNKQVSLEEKLTEKKFKQYYDYVTDILNNMKDSREVIKYSRRFNLKKDDLIELLKVFELVFDTLLHNKEHSTLYNIYNPKLIGMCLKSLDTAILKAYSNCNPNIVMDTFFLDILENKYLVNLKG